MEESGLIQPVREEKGISIAFPECGKLVPPVIALTGFYLTLTLFFYWFCCTHTNTNARTYACMPTQTGTDKGIVSDS